jgi:probable phosphoglycerate mutase
MTTYPEIYVLRHVETVWNREGRWQGSLDSPLTEMGRAQAVEMGARLGAEGVSATTHVAWSSPQGRALRTCELALKPLGIGAELCDGLREIGIGEWTGMTLDEMRAGWPDFDLSGWIDVYSKAPGGEGFEALWERAGLILAHLRQPTIIVTHGITSRILRTRAMGLSLADMEDLPGGQGVIHHIQDGVHRTF